MLVLLFFITLSVACLSGLIFLHPKIPLRYVRIHICIVALPPLASLLALINTNMNEVVGPWNLDSLAWLLVLFVLSMGLIIQRFSVRLLNGRSLL